MARPQCGGFPPLKIAYIDHSFHQETRSTDFFRSLLRDAGEVDLFWDESWRNGRPAPFDRICSGDYDLAVVFQAESAAAEMLRRHPPFPVVFVPMWDSSGSFGRNFWTKDLRGARVVCFSQWQFQRLARWGVDAYPARYWPEPPDSVPPIRDSGMKAFFWWRRSEWPVNRIGALCDTKRLRSLHVHLGPDPGHVLDEAQLADLPLPVTISRWGAAADKYRAALADSDVVFAPRMEEGIGMAVLEAMASGKVVIAPDRPTMNEYITDGVTGYLVPDNYNTMIGLDRAQEIGRRARLGAIAGRQQWHHEIPALLDWIVTGRKSRRRDVTGAGDAAARSADLVVGDYEERAGEHWQEHKVAHPDVWRRWAETDPDALLSRLPVPECVWLRGEAQSHATPQRLTELLLSGPVHHAGCAVARLARGGLRDARARARFQAGMLRGLGVPRREIKRALHRKLTQLKEHAYEEAVSRHRLLSSPAVWPEVVRRAWSIARFHGLRGGFAMLVGRKCQRATGAGRASRPSSGLKGPTL
jgi:hypothetical protein